MYRFEFLKRGVSSRERFQRVAVLRVSCCPPTARSKAARVQDDGAFHCVAQFPDIARPLILGEAAAFPHPDRGAFAVATGEMVGERHDEFFQIFKAFAQQAGWSRG